MPPAFDEEEVERVFMQAMDKWLDKQFLMFGKWSLGSLAAAIFIALIYFMLWANGWTNKLQDKNLPNKERQYDERNDGDVGWGGSRS